MYAINVLYFFKCKNILCNTWNIFHCSHDYFKWLDNNIKHLFGFSNVTHIDCSRVLVLKYFSWDKLEKYDYWVNGMTLSMNLVIYIWPNCPLGQ